jgi:hypothetical protein
MSISLPNSPVRKIYRCSKCGDISIRFYNPIHDRAYSQVEWENIITDGKEVLYKLLQNVRENPTLFA